MGCSGWRIFLQSSFFLRQLAVQTPIGQMRIDPVVLVIKQSANKEITQKEIS